jgi:phage repressor protein C with HTH and peptisase S24 domain
MECVMAKRTKPATARKAKALKKASKKVAKKAKAPKKQSAKRPLKTKAKRQKTSAKSGRSGARKSASRRRRMPTQQETPQPEMMIVETPRTETTIVDVIEEPVPGVYVVTEVVETNAEPEPPDSLNIDQTVGPKSEEQLR